MEKNEVLTVSQVTNAIKKNLESTFPFVKIKGEITNLRRQSSGHIYFSLKDAHSQISAVLFKGIASQMKETPKDGDEVVLSGELNLYAPRGTYQIIARSLIFSGVGDLLMKLHEMKIFLEEKGWFAKENKKPLPFLPKRIGVVTSPSGAVIQDIIHVLERRFSTFHLILCPVKVQGAGAAEEIAEAITHLNATESVDVIIVGRGGGSLEDLWPFNELCVASAIYESKIPVVSAVGHETDFSIADFVADVRAPTPSAAAEIVLKEKSSLVENLTRYKASFCSLLAGQIRQKRLILERFKKHPTLTDPFGALHTLQQKLDLINQDLNTVMQNKLSLFKEQLAGRKRLLKPLSPISRVRSYRHRVYSIQRGLERIHTIIERKRENFGKVVSHLFSLNPDNVVKKGYCICFHENSHSVIISSKEVKKNQKITLQMKDGSVNFTAN